MATLAEIRAGLAANLGSITGLQVSAYVLSNPTPPCVEIVPAEVQYDQALARGMDTVTMTVRVFVGQASDKGAQQRLDLYLAPDGSGSVKAAIESDPTLVRTVADLHVTSATGYRVYGDTALLGCEWTVEVIT